MYSRLLFLVPHSVIVLFHSAVFVLNWWTDSVMFRVLSVMYCRSPCIAQALDGLSIEVSCVLHNLQYIPHHALVIMFTYWSLSLSMTRSALSRRPLTTADFSAIIYASSVFLNFVTYTAPSMTNVQFKTTPQFLDPFFVILVSGLDLKKEVVSSSLRVKLICFSSQGERIQLFCYCHSRAWSIPTALKRKVIYCTPGLIDSISFASSINTVDKGIFYPFGFHELDLEIF